MQQLHLVGLTTDLDSIICSARKGAKSGSFMLPLDERLLQVIAEAVSRRNADGVEIEVPEALQPPSASAPRRQSHLSPREIQDRLRAGRSMEEIAAEAGVGEEWVARFAAPVEAERSQVVGRARRLTYYRPRRGDSGEPLGMAVRWNLADRGVRLANDEFDAAWSAYQLADTAWMVTFRYEARKREHEAEWEVDLATNELLSRNRLATELGYVEPSRRRRAVASLQPVASAAVVRARAQAAAADEDDADDGADERGRSAAVPSARGGGVARPAKKAAAKRPAARSSASSGGTTSGKRPTARAGGSSRAGAAAAKRPAARTSGASRSTAAARAAAAGTRGRKAAAATKAAGRGAKATTKAAKRPAKAAARTTKASARTTKASAASGRRGASTTTRATTKAASRPAKKAAARPTKASPRKTVAKKSAAVKRPAKKATAARPTRRTGRGVPPAQATLAPLAVVDDRPAPNELGRRRLQLVGANPPTRPSSRGGAAARAGGATMPGVRIAASRSGDVAAAQRQARRPPDREAVRPEPAPPPPQEIVAPEPGLDVTDSEAAAEARRAERRRARAAARGEAAPAPVQPAPVPAQSARGGGDADDDRVVTIRANRASPPRGDAEVVLPADRPPLRPAQPAAQPRKRLFNRAGR